MADLRGGAREPPGSKCFQFHAVFGKIWENRLLAHPLGELAPLRENAGSATDFRYNNSLAGKHRSSPKNNSVTNKNISHKTIGSQLCTLPIKQLIHKKIHFPHKTSLRSRYSTPRTIHLQTNYFVDK